MRTTLAAVAAATLALTLALGLAGPAHAERYGVDEVLDTFHGSDILSLEVVNGQDDLRVVTHHDGLRRDPRTGSAGEIYVDTDRRDPGPEYVLTAGFTARSDFVLRKTDGFARSTWGDPVEHGDYDVDVDYARDRVTTLISQGALDEPDEVRVSVRAWGTRTDGTRRHLVDWVGKPRWFTLWLARG